MTDKIALTELSVLRAILALLVDERARATNPTAKIVSVELMLAAAGLDYRTVAELVGKKPDAVRMMLNRNQGKGES